MSEEELKRCEKEKSPSLLVPEDINVSELDQQPADTQPEKPEITTPECPEPTTYLGPPIGGTDEKEKDEFLPPPPASTLLIRRTRVSSSGAPTYMVSPGHKSPSAIASPPPGPSGPPPKKKKEDTAIQFKRSWGGKPAATWIRKKAKEHAKMKARKMKHVNIDPLTGKRRYIKKNRPTKKLKTSHEKKVKAHASGSVSSIQSVEDDDYEEEEEEEEVIDVTKPPLAEKGVWRPLDDLRLIVNVRQVNDLEIIAKSVRFSGKYSVGQIQARWRKLLYDQPTAKVSQLAIKRLHPRLRRKIYANALPNAQEIEFLKQIPSKTLPEILEEEFEFLLLEHIDVFLKGRNPRILSRYWHELRDLHLLCDQKVSDYYIVQNFSDFEDSVVDEDLVEMEEGRRLEILAACRRNRARIRRVEEEIELWSAMSSLVLEIPHTDFDEGTFAVIRGKAVRYLMRSREITVGRNGKGWKVDADLSLEGSTFGVSRLQAKIRLIPAGVFLISNEGKHPFYVQGKTVLPEKSATLRDQAVIEFGSLAFVFLVNHKLVEETRRLAESDPLQNQAL